MSEQEKLRWAWLQGWNNWTESGRNHNADINPYQMFRLPFVAFADGFRSREKAEYLAKEYGISTQHTFRVGGVWMTVPEPLMAGLLSEVDLTWCGRKLDI